MGFHDELARIARDPEIRRLAERRAASRELAEDALQETYYAVARTRSPEHIRDLRAFFCTSLIREINHQLVRPAPILTDDIGAISDRGQGRPSPFAGARPAPVESQAHLGILAEAVLKRLDGDWAQLFVLIPARSNDPRRYQVVILGTAKAVLWLLLEGYVTQADWSAILKRAYPQWCDEPGLAREAVDQRLSRARRDVQGLLRQMFSRDDLAS